MFDGCWFPELPAESVPAVGVPVTTPSSSWGMTQQQEQQLLLHQQASGIFYGNNMQDDNNYCHNGEGDGTLLYGGWYSEAGCPYIAMVLPSQCVRVCVRARTR